MNFSSTTFYLYKLLHPYLSFLTGKVDIVIVLTAHYYCPYSMGDAWKALGSVSGTQ